MKKLLSLALVFLMIVSVFSGCGKKNEEQNNNVPNEQTPNAESLYMFRDLPEAKYITPATDFAGGNGTEGDPYQISNAEQLALVHKKIVDDHKELKSHYENAYYVLTSDIQVNDVTNFDNWDSASPEYSWTPIGFASSNFNGVFDGKGYNISGLYINTNCGTAEENSNDNYGLFDTVNGTVKNVNITKSYFAVSGRPTGVGGIAGLLMSKAVVDNCNVEAVLNVYDSATGGIAGKSYGGVNTVSKDRNIEYSLISSCSFSGVINQIKDNASTHIGGIIGDCDGNISTGINKGTFNFSAGDVDSVGGIAGYMSEGSIEACKNEGSVSCKAEENGLAIGGGIVGKVFVSSVGSENMSRGAKISKCENYGTVTADMYAGGIVGQVSNDNNDYCITVSECFNKGVVSAKDYTGGIIGHINCVGDSTNGSDSVIVEKCENSKGSNVTGLKAEQSKGIVGGIIASLMTEKGDVKIRDCNNMADLTSDGQHCAGIVAYWIMNSKPSSTKISVDNCKNSGSISSKLNAGGIISFMDMPVCLEMGSGVSVSVTNCTNDGKITTDTVNGYIGGILGNWGMANVATEINRCTNNGTLSITAKADSMTDEDAKKMTVSRIAGGIIGRVGSGLLLTTDSDKADNKNVQSSNAVLKIIDCKNTGTLDVVNITAENYKNWFGGIIGNTCGEDGFAFYVNNCTYTGFDRGLGNENLNDVGTKK